MQRAGWAALPERRHQADASRDVELITNPDRACAMARLKEAQCCSCHFDGEPFGM
jgi:hypothetical protein